jgi:hypothetical protein
VPNDLQSGFGLLDALLVLTTKADVEVILDTSSDARNTKTRRNFQAILALKNHSVGYFSPNKAGVRLP